MKELQVIGRQGIRKYLLLVNQDASGLIELHIFNLFLQFTQVWWKRDVIRKRAS